MHGSDELAGNCDTRQGGVREIVFMEYLVNINEECLLSYLNNPTRLDKFVDQLKQHIFAKKNLEFKDHIISELNNCIDRL